jgi:sirohydrochlorin ferrochelatase
MPDQPALLVAAHGTASPAGSATTAALVAAIAEARPDVPVSLCFLDVAAPRLTDALVANPVPMVVVPLLLSAGFHVLTDIPAVVAGHPQVLVARHLGPDPLIVDVLVARLAEVRATAAVATTVLVAAGSSNPAAAADVAQAAEQLGERLGRPVSVLTLGSDVRAALAGAAAPVEVATYLLAEGQFVDNLRAAASGVATVADPIGVHPALVALVLARYDETVAAH